MRLQARPPVGRWPRPQTTIARLRASHPGQHTVQRGAGARRMLKRPSRRASSAPQDEGVPSRRASSAPPDEGVGVQLGRSSRLRVTQNVGIYPRMETTCYCAAVRTAARKTTALYDSLLEPAGVTLAQFSLLQKNRARRNGFPDQTRATGGIGPIDGRAKREGARRASACALGLGARTSAKRRCGSRLPEKSALRRAAPLWEEAQRRVEAALGATRSGAAADARA